VRGRKILALLATAALACGGRVLETTATEVLGTPAEDGGGLEAMTGSGNDSGGSSGGGEGAPGNESGSGEGADSGVGGDAESGDGLAPSPDAVAPLSCTLTGLGSSSGGMITDISWVETCSNGSTYSVTCECPSAFCCCNGINCPPFLGDGDGGVPYAECDASPSWLTDAGESAAWAACGYPQPN
jgi:hypothetical protein